MNLQKIVILNPVDFDVDFRETLTNSWQYSSEIKLSGKGYDLFVIKILFIWGFVQFTELNFLNLIPHIRYILAVTNIQS